jgi:hypothetical protein
MYGHMSSVRISDNERYSTSSTSITVPTSEFTSDSNTVLLLGQGDTPLADASSNSYSVTVNGNPRASEVGPYTADDAGEGGLVWVKTRAISDNHTLIDNERGGTFELNSNSSSSQGGGLDFTFNSNGFSIGNSIRNANNQPYASWTFRKAPKFFDVVTYTGNGTSQYISHNLGCEVGAIFVKRTDATANWSVYHRGQNATAPEDYYMILNLTDEASNNNGFWLDTAPTTTNFRVGNDSTVNASGGTYVAYLFAHNDGDGDFGPDGDADIIKCGSYTGTGSEMFIDLGFEPQWILTRRTDTTDNWFMVDTMRGIVSGGGEDYLWANTSDAEQATSAGWAVNPTGFTVESSSRYASGGTYIYIAIRRGPMAVPTDATEVFSTTLGTNTTDWTYDAGFPVDWTLYTARTGGDNFTFNRMTGSKYLTTSSSLAENSYTVGFDNMSFVDLSPSTNNGFVIWDWKRAPSFFDVVAYTGNGTAGRTVSHNLGVAPEMMWIKNRDGARNWAVYHKELGGTKLLYLNGTNASITESNIFNNTDPTESVFTLGSNRDVNSSISEDHIAYLFASLDGVSKVGSFTYTQGVAQNIDCGFSSGARFVLYKRTSGTSGWTVFDTERGIVAGNDPMLFLNTTSAEDSSYDFIDPYSGGFALSDSTANLSGDYIFYAIA